MKIVLMSHTLVNSPMMKLKIHEHELPIQEIKTATELDLSTKELDSLDAESAYWDWLRALVGEWKASGTAATDGIAKLGAFKATSKAFAKPHETSLRTQTAYSATTKVETNHPTGCSRMSSQLRK